MTLDELAAKNLLRHKDQKGAVAMGGHEMGEPTSLRVETMLRYLI
jgi:hypothetical protein